LNYVRQCLFCFPEEQHLFHFALVFTWLQHYAVEYGRGWLFICCFVLFLVTTGAELQYTLTKNRTAIHND
jgi:hypothetical protein